MKRHFLPVVAVLACVAVSTFGQDPAAKAPAGPGFQVTGMKCFSDKIINKLETGKGGFKLEAGFRVGTNLGPGSELEDFTFPEDQMKQFFTFEFGAAGAKKEITATVKAMKTTLGANLKVVSVSGTTDAEGKLPAEWSMKRNWPVGLYKVFFTCNDQPVGSAGYLVKAVKDRESPITSEGVTILSYRDGKAVPKTALTPDDNDLIIKCATKGANTKGADIRMFIGYIDDKGEKLTLPDSEVTMEKWPLEDTELIYTFEMGKKMPVGKFFMVYLINGEELAVHPFTIAE